MATPTSVDALVPGDHACLTFSDAEERLDIVAAFVRDGLALGHKIVCFTDSISPGVLTGELTDRRVPTAQPFRRGQLAVRGSDDGWLAGGMLSAAKMIDLLATELDLAGRQGYRALRITADMAWATRPVATVDQLLVFESEVRKLFSDGRLTAICQYDRQAFDPVTLAFAAKVHPMAVAATVYHEDPVLRICRQHSPPGLRVAGEIDYTRTDVLHQALGEAVRLDEHTYVNLIQLRFIDAAAASAIVGTAAALPKQRRMTVLCRGLVRRMLDMVGASEVANLRVTVGYGEP